MLTRKDSIERTLIAINAAEEDAKTKNLKKGSGGISRLPCPIPGCNGILSYSVASINGHIWGSCSNPTCVRWMQ